MASLAARSGPACTPGALHRHVAVCQALMNMLNLGSLVMKLDPVSA